MTDIEMLPLPEALFETGSRRDLFNVAQMEGYARAVAEHNVRFLTHELANAECAIDAEQAGRKKAEAEIEALRAEREVLVTEAVKYADKSGRLEARAEQLAEALQKLATHIRPTCSVLWDEAQAALRDHDQEGKDG